MTMVRKGIMTAAVVALALAVSAREKKIVSFSWEWQRTSPEDLVEWQPQIHAVGLDGIGFSISFRQGDATFSSNGICTEPWDYEAMRPLVEKYRKVVGKPGLTDCFLTSFYVPKKRFDWKDDKAWVRVRENMRLAARFAKETGCVGLRIDHEDYPYQRQFERLPCDPPMDELEGIVRKRGREIFSGVFEEFPNAKLFFFWFMTEHAKHFNGAAEPLQALRDANKLWAFFANGIMDAMPPGGRIYDGNECSYEYKSGDFEYLTQANATRQMDGFAYPENREKYRTQVSPSAALFLEMYCRTNSATQWYRPPFAGSRLGMFRRDLKQALDSVDEYLWTFSGQHPYIRRPKTADTTWPAPVWRNETFDELMPGFNRAIVAIKNPVRFLDEIYPVMMAAPGAPANLVSPDISPRSNWQAKPKKGCSLGTFVTDDSVFGDTAPSVKIESVGNGCLLESVKNVQAGEIYAVRIRTKVQSGGFYARVGWQRGGKWRHFEPASALTFGKPDERGWRTGRAVATVPENVDTLVFVFNVNQEKGEKCWVDDAEIVRVK